MPLLTTYTKLGEWSALTNTPTLPTIPALAEGEFYHCMEEGDFLNLHFRVDDCIYAIDGSYQIYEASHPEEQMQAIVIPPADHTHGVGDVTGLQPALDGKQPAGSYAPSTHTHAQADVTGLVTALAGKASSAHTHAQADVTNLVTDLAGKAASVHTHAATAITEDATHRFATDAEKTTWNGKANAVHTHAISDTTGLQAALDGKQAAGSYAAAAHSHAQADITGLTAALAGKETAGAAATAQAFAIQRANHTGTQAATTIVEDATHRFATDAEKATWNAAGGGSSPTWHGKLYAARGSCDPHDLLRVATNGGSIAVTPTALTITVARISYFTPPADIVVNKIRFYGVGATTNVYRCAIYNGNTLERLTAELPFSTAAATWGSAGTGLNLTLTAGTQYFIAVSVNAVGTVAGILCLGPTVAATTGVIAVLPKSWPGNLDIDLGYITSGYAQFAVSTGALPATAPTIAAQAAWTGGFPLFFLDNNNA